MHDVTKEACIDAMAPQRSGLGESHVRGAKE